MKIKKAGRWLTLLAAVWLAGCSNSSVVSAPVQPEVVTQPERGTQPESVPETALAPVKLVSIPETDCDIRRWYNYQVVALPVINQRWIEAGFSLEERARRAFDIRHRARVNARYMMADGVEKLRQRDLEKYGNPDGPTFDYLVHKSRTKGMTYQQAWKNIITTSARTNNGYNAKCVKINRQ
ncbi:MAG: hypothetical protein OIF57_08575 [Marinobacterium sp.]|nr:hypothetical protein [Marinobacterium sp.]